MSLVGNRLEPCVRKRSVECWSFSKALWISHFLSCALHCFGSFKFAWSGECLTTSADRSYFMPCETLLGELGVRSNEDKPQAWVCRSFQGNCVCVCMSLCVCSSKPVLPPLAATAPLVTTTPSIGACLHGYRPQEKKVMEKGQF